MLGGTLFRKKLALMRLEHALQNLSALRRLGVGHAHAGNFEALPRTPRRVAVADAQRRLGDESQSSPFKVRTQLENLRHRAKRGAVSFPWHHALVLIFYPGLARLELPKDHHNRLQNIQRLEAGNRDGFIFIPRDPLVRPASDYC